MSLAPAVAITGISLRVAGASDVNAFWENLARKRDPFSALPNARFDPQIFAGELPGGRARTARGALVEDFALDWRALRLPPAQVEHLHRVERLSLAAMGDALMDANLRMRSGPLDKGGIWFAANTIGPDPWLDPVARIRRSEFLTPLRDAVNVKLPTRAGEIGALLDRVSDMAAPPLEPDVLMISACIIAGRASHIYDFRGGHLAIDVGMCSSLAAVLQATRSLQVGACDVALVCAAAPLVTPSGVLALAHRGELAEDIPRPFSPKATGTLLGDGAVAIVLERADDVARKRVYALVEGVGSSVAPAQSGNEALAHCVAEAANRALAQAGISGSRVDLIESRASGIAASDHAEVEGLAAVYGRTGDNAPTILTSSVPAVGFLQAASGLVALAKAALALHRRCWPGQSNADGAHDPVPGLRVPVETTSWTGARRAAVSDAGPDSIAYHAILADPRERQVVARLARRVTHREPIAIVGVGVVAPDASNIEEFWRNALTRKEIVRDLPRSRWNVDRLIGSSIELARAFRTRLAATVDLPTLDTARYGVTPTTATTMDPAVSLAIGVVDQALRDVGYRAGVWDASRVQVVFGQISLRTSEAALENRIQYSLLVELASEVMKEAGISPREVDAVVAEARVRFDRDNLHFSADSQAAFSGLSTASRAAAAFGFSGEVLSVDAACASSLVAVKIASEALLTGEADVVLAGGVSYHLLPEYYVGLGLLDALSTRAGRPFHRDADGFVPAEAAGAVVLKRLSDARQANDHVYAVITGHGISSDGHGLTIYSPNTLGQQLAIARALASAGVPASAIDLLEAHGPGAPLGDRTEIASLAAAYGERPFLPPLSIVSAKSLIGHSSSAGAMISLIRAALALTAKVLPPSGGNGDLAPDIPFGPTLELSRVARPWIATGRRRRAAVNSFGMTGINHHVVLEEVDPLPTRQEVPNAALDHPMIRPGQPLNASRFVPVEVAVTLPERPPLHGLRGRILALVPDRGGLWREVERTLAARGAQVIRLMLPVGTTDADVRAALPDPVSSIHGIVDLSAFDALAAPLARGSNALWTALKEYSDRTFALLRVLYERFQASDFDPACYVAVVSVRAEPNSGTPAEANPLGAFFQGLARSLKQELPTLLCKAIDVDPAMPLPQAAAAIVSEVEDGNERVDVRYSHRRMITTLRRTVFGDSSPLRRKIRPNDVFLFSGGGRGVVYHCATALARLGVNVVVTGRRPLPDASRPWVRMSTSEFSAFRREELAKRRATEGPARIVRSLDDLDLQRQAHANVTKAQAAGLPFHYEVCDITDLDSVKSVTQRVRSRFGHIDGVGHGAMIEHSATVSRKTQQIIDATLNTKVVGLANLLEATRQDDLGFVVAFGSAVGRFGNSGQTDYAASNATVAALLETYANDNPARPHCVTIDWPAWESLGATANPDVAELLRAAGVTSISPDEGSYWFLSELALGDATEVVICGDPMVQSWPGFVHGADGLGERAIEFDDHGRVLLPSRWPMIDCRGECDADSLTLRRQISVERDLYMSQHKLNGLPVLPAAFGCELLAEGALLACPGYYVREIRDFQVDAPLGLPRERPVVATVCTRVLERSETERVVQCEARTPLAVRLEREGQERRHHSARVRLSAAVPSPLGTADIPRRTEVTHATSFYGFVHDPVDLGPLFGGARWIQTFGDEAIGEVEPPDLYAIHDNMSEPCFVLSPLVLDASLQVAGSWDGYCNGFASVPVGIESLVLGRPPAKGERIRVHARVTQVEHPILHYDISLVGQRSEVLAKLRNVQLKRVGSPVSLP